MFRTLPVAPDTGRADTSSIATPESLKVRVRVPPPKAPPPIVPAGRPAAIASASDSLLRASTDLDPRDALRRSLGVGAIEAGSPDLPEPLFAGIPGRDVPEIRVNGLPIAPARWPETSLLPLPLIAVGEGSLRRYAPIDGPLSSTGGPMIDVREGEIPNDRAVSVIRVTRASYATFAEEILLRRPMGSFLVGGSYGTTKTNGRVLWGNEFGESTNLRAQRVLAGGLGELAYDDGHHRDRLLATKRGFWNRKTWTLRWSRPDSAGGGGIETAIQWKHDDSGWWTLRGLTKREGRSVFVHGLAQRAWAGGMGSIAFETEVARTRFDRLNAAHALLHDVGTGVAVGWTRTGARRTDRVSAGIVRLAPLAPGPVFAAESEVGIAGGSIHVHASRAIRNRTLVRLPTDGEAWIRQGIDLADEKSGERPEALWRAGIEARRTVGRALAIAAGLDGLLDTSGFGGSDTDAVLLGIDQQDRIPAAMLRRSRSFASPWGRAALDLPHGFRLSGRGTSTVAQGGVRAQIGLAAMRADGEIGWRGRLFKGDLHVDLSLVGHARTKVATPYGVLGGQAILDGEIRGRIDTADIFFVLANLTDIAAPSMSWDGSFMDIPRRHYRAGLRWTFVD